MANHESFFSYTITRPYPYRWFTPVAISGGIILLVAATVINMVASGYELISECSMDPDATTNQHVWFKNWPDWLASTKPTCAATIVPLETSLYTNNTVLPWTLLSASEYDASGNTTDSESLYYYNYQLQNCSISGIQVTVESTHRDAAESAAMAVGATVHAEATCLVNSQNAKRQNLIQLFTSWYPLGPGYQPSSQFLGVNATAKSSLYWGESVARLYWANFLMNYFQDSTHLDPPLYKANFVLDRPTTWQTTDHGPNSTDFLRLAFCIATQLNATGMAENSPNVCEESESLDHMIGTGHLPNVWEPLGVMAKAMWFLLLADLGQDDSPSEPNILAQADSLAVLTQNMTQVNSSISEPFRFEIDAHGLSLNPYIMSEEADSHLFVNQSVLVTSYTCQVPRRKAMVSLIIPIIVANLVLLQAGWQLFVYLVDQFFISKDKELSYCTGCSGSQGDVMPLIEGASMSQYDSRSTGQRGSLGY